MASWLVAVGETGELIRDFDWSSTRLGPLESWPQSLRTAVNFMLEARQPVYIAWGTECISLYNDGYLPILADKHPGALGKPYSAVWPELWEEYRPHVDAVMGGHAQYWVDQPVMFSNRPNRPVSWFTFSWTPLRDEKGLVAGFLCVATETTEKILAERQLVDLMDEGYCVIEVIFEDDTRPVDYRFLKTNPAFEQQTGLSKVEGRTVRELIPDFEQQWIDTYGKVALTGQPIRLINDAPSMGRWFDAYAFRIAGKFDQVGVLFRDITERKLAEQRLQDADRRKDEFLAMLAHELRNPLAPIRSAADLLAMSGFDETNVRQASAIISRQVRHMVGLLEDLLDVSRVTRGLVKIKPERLDARQIILDAIEQVRPLLETRGHHTIFRTPPETPSVAGDHNRLVQVVANLLSNAAKYTPEGGHIAVALEVIGDVVSIDVTDDGIGMEPELITHAFELFAQAKRTSDRSQGGLGIGLALVRSLVELHGGSVTAHSEGLGKGSRFTISLPHTAERSATLVADQLQSPGRATAKLKILIVDDNQDAAQVLGMYLEALGHQIIVEHGAHEALERAKLEWPQVCLLDIGLPHMDGNELARHLRKQPETAASFLVAISGYGQEQDRAISRAAGFDDYFVKPVDTLQLGELLNQFGAAGKDSCPA